MARHDGAAARSSTARTARADALLSIGQVLARLTPDFPDLTPSKLRFLDEQGLVSPARTPSGYRKFCSADLDRLRLILTMQREHYLPLKVIRGYLAELDAGKTPALPGTPATLPTMLVSGRRLGRDELVREASATPALLQEAVSASLLAPADVYDEDALAVLRALVELQRHGIGPRHLRAFRAGVERELGLIESAVTPLTRRKDGARRTEAVEAAEDIAGQLETVRGSLIRTALGRFGP